MDLTAFATILLAFVTLALAFATWWLAREAGRTRQQDVMPILRLDANPDNSPQGVSKGLWIWKLKNIGAGAAIELRCERHDEGLVTHTDFAQHARNIIGAREEWTHYLEDYPNFRDVARLHVKFCYQDIFGNDFETEINGHRNTFRIIRAPYRPRKRQ